MTYSEATMERMERVLSVTRDSRPCMSCGIPRNEPPRWGCGQPSNHTARPRPSQDAEWLNIGDTCCGKCAGASCYVDQVTGA